MSEEASDKDAPIDEDAPPAKKKRRNKRKKDKRTDAPAAKPAAEPAKKEKLGAKLWLVLLAIGIAEVFLFGSRGHIEVCVARDGVHDFALLGQERNDENTQRYPTCEKRLNIGITSHFDEVLEGATIHACTRANILRSTTEKAICVIKEDGWQHRVVTDWCPPWHDHYYKRLLWFAFPE